MDWAWFSDFLDWLWALPRRFFVWLVDAVGDMLVAIPAPEFFSDVQGALNAIPTGVVWFLDLAQIGFGFGVILSAYVIRFAIRRLPVVG